MYWDKKNNILTGVVLGRLQYPGVFWVCIVKSGRWIAHISQNPRCHNPQNYNMNVHRQQNLISGSATPHFFNTGLTSQIALHTPLLAASEHISSAFVNRVWNNASRDMTPLYTHLFDTRRRIYETASSKLLAGTFYQSIEVNAEQPAADKNEACAQRTIHRDRACLLRGASWIIISPIFSNTIRAASRAERILRSIHHGKGKGKGRARTGHEDPKGVTGIALLFP